MLFFWGKRKRNRARIFVIRDGAATAVEALALMLTDGQIEDDGTVSGRVRAILLATEHPYMMGLHTGAKIGVTGFRNEYEDPWKQSADQVGHFLTAVRFAFDSRFLINPIYPLVLGGWGHRDRALRLMVGHEKAADPVSIDQISPRVIIDVLRCFRRQYRSATAEDVANFCVGKMDTIVLGNGLGNSMADLLLSYQGWLFGQWVVEGWFKTRQETADWIRRELGPAVSPLLFEAEGLGQKTGGDLIA
jgi:hypothetical protein